MASVAAIAMVAGRLAVQVGLSIALAEGVARAGAGLLPGLIRDGARGRPGERFGLAFLLGLSAAGFAFFGIALTGLFLPVALAGVGGAMLMGSRATWTRELLTWRAALECRHAGGLGFALVAAALFVPSVQLLVPEQEHDVWVYHLGFAWQCLQIHRLPLELVPHPFWFSLPVEMAFTVPLLLGDERLVKGLLLGCFAAAGAVFVSDRRRADPGGPSGWLGPLLVLASAQTLFLLSVSKNDVVASALFVCGAWLQLSGRLSAGCLLLGLALAAKAVYGPLVAVFALVMAARSLPQGRLYLDNLPWRRLAWCALLLGLPVVPWWIRTWLGTGNPLFPLATSVFPSFDWGEANQEAFRLYRATNVPEGIPELREVPLVWSRYLARTHLPVLLGFPLLLAVRRWRPAVAACLAAQWLIIAMLPRDRYLLPSTWLLAFLLAVEAGRLRGWTRTAVLAILVVYSLGRGTQTDEFRRLSLASLAHTRAELRARAYSTFLEAARLIRRHAPVAPRVLSFGEWRTHRFPCRLLFGGMFGETPVMWRLGETSHTPEEMRKRLRQLGVSTILYNYISVDWASLRYYPFPWNRRSLRLCVDFSKRYLEIAGRSERCDFINGGFYVFTVLPEPREKPLDEIWFVPGTDSVYGKGIRLRNVNRKQESLEEYLAILDVIPDVGQAWNRVGHAYALLSDAPKAYRYYKRFTLQGMMDSTNLGEFGAVATQVGELEIADRILAEALERYPAHRQTVRINRATWHGQKAFRALVAGRLDEALGQVAAGQAVIDLVPETLDTPQNTRARQTALAFLIGLQAEVSLARGEREEAAKGFARAAEMAPKVSMAARWKRLATDLSPRPFGKAGKTR